MMTLDEAIDAFSGSVLLAVPDDLRDHIWWHVCARLGHPVSDAGAIETGAAQVSVATHSQVPAGKFKQTYVVEPPAAIKGAIEVVVR